MIHGHELKWGTLGRSRERCRGIQERKKWEKCNIIKTKYAFKNHHHHPPPKKERSEKETSMYGVWYHLGDGKGQEKESISPTQNTKYFLKHLAVYFFLRFYLFIFRQRGRERERQG